MYWDYLEALHSYWNQHLKDDLHLEWKQEHEYHANDLQDLPLNHSLSHKRLSCIQLYKQQLALLDEGLKLILMQFQNRSIGNNRHQ